MFCIRTHASGTSADSTTVGTYLFQRVSKSGGDSRFDKIKKDVGLLAGIPVLVHTC